MKVTVHFVRQPETVHPGLERIEMLCGVRLRGVAELGPLVQLDRTGYQLCAECEVFMTYQLEADRAARARVNLPQVTLPPAAVWGPASGPGVAPALASEDDERQARARSWYQTFVKSRPRPRAL